MRFSMVCESVSEELVQHLIPSANAIGVRGVRPLGRKCFKVTLRSDRNEGTNNRPEFGDVHLTTTHRFTVGKKYMVEIR